jgi:hypothetical protein
MDGMKQRYERHDRAYGECGGQDNEIFRFLREHGASSRLI